MNRDGRNTHYRQVSLDCVNSLGAQRSSLQATSVSFYFTLWARKPWDFVDRSDADFLNGFGKIHIQTHTNNTHTYSLSLSTSRSYIYFFSMHISWDACRLSFCTFTPTLDLVLVSTETRYTCGGGGVFFLACKDFWENVQQFIPRLRFFFLSFFLFFYFYFYYFFGKWRLACAH